MPGRISGPSTARMSAAPASRDPLGGAWGRYPSPSPVVAPSLAGVDRSNRSQTAACRCRGHCGLGCLNGVGVGGRLVWIPARVGFSPIGRPSRSLCFLVVAPNHPAMIVTCVAVSRCELVLRYVYCVFPLLRQCFQVLGSRRPPLLVPAVVSLAPFLPSSGRGMVLVESKIKGGARKR